MRTAFNDYGPYRGHTLDPRTPEPTEYEPDPRELTAAAICVYSLDHCQLKSQYVADCMARSLADYIRRLPVTQEGESAIRALLVFADRCAYQLEEA